MNNVLIDTSCFIDFFRSGKGVIEAMLHKPQPANIFLSTSTIVVYELYRGSSMNNPQIESDVDAFLNLYRIIPVSKEIAMCAGLVERRYKIKGNDALIAATCLCEDAFLATNNYKHFNIIPDLKLFSLPIT